MSPFLMGVRKIIQSNIIFCRKYCKQIANMKYLNVAEKNDAAKNIAGHLSRGTSRRREGFSPYNKIYEFEAQVFNQKCTMVMTSVSGHLLNYKFGGMYRNWTSCNPLELFDAPVTKECQSEDYEKIKRTIIREVQSCSGLIIWTDCDREGENIGFEIIDVCLSVKPNLPVHRARFSEITATSVHRALQNLERPNKNVSNAVDVRQELDLRIGASFTRLQTLRLQQVFPQKLADKLISYGSCQFPTLGFVVDRYKASVDFIPQAFWRIMMTHTMNDITVEFHWNRDRLFEEPLVKALLEKCQEQPIATITKVISKPKSKWRPLPLDTVEMEKIISRKLRINAKTTMKIAEKLYSQGIISYPRTETNIFPENFNLPNLVQLQSEDQQWGNFAARILETGGPNPRRGKKSDQAHPPIHPTKYTNSLTGDEKRVYEFIVRHFLACCSKDAKGYETIVDAIIADEMFQAKGLMILERNYLEVYPYERWSDKEIHAYQEGQQFTPTLLDLAEGSTTAPPLLTEADLIVLMERHGIGTDATHAEHIATIQAREYVALPDGIHFVPGNLGMGLVEGYDKIGLDVSLAKPNLRAELESDLKKICEGTKRPEAVLTEQINKYRQVYRAVYDRIRQIDAAIAERINAQPVENVGFLHPTEPSMSPFKCPQCGSNMFVRDRKTGGKYISCSSFPACKNACWLPSGIKEVVVTNETCTECGPNFKKIKFTFENNLMFGMLPNPLTTCIGGCDSNIVESLSINLNTVRAGRNNTVNHNNEPVNRIPAVQNVPNNRNQVPNNNDNHRNSFNDRMPPSNGFGTQTNTSQWGSGSLNSTTVIGGRDSNTNQRPASSSDTSQWGSANFNSTRVVGSRDNNTIQRPASSTDTSQWGSTNFNSTRVVGSRDNNTTQRPASSTDTSQWSSANLNSTRAVGSRDSNTTQSNTNGYDGVVCQCNQPALQLTVRKQGPNLGKLFYKCNKSRDNGGCDFFLWAVNDDENNQPRGSDRNSTSNNSAAVVQCNCGETAVVRVVQKDTPNKGRSFYTCPKPQATRCQFFKWADEVDQQNGGGGGDDGGGGGGNNYGGAGGSGYGGGGGGGNNYGGAGGSGYGGGNSWAAGGSGNWGSSNSSYTNKQSNWKGKQGRPTSKKPKSDLGTVAAGTKGKRKCGICGEEGIDYCCSTR